MRIYAARWVCPVASAPIENGCVAVNDEGRIAFVGDWSAAPTGEKLDLGNAILLPGFVNAHTHLELTSMRGAIAETEFFAWIRAVVARKKEKLDESEAYRSARSGIAEGLRLGTTTFGDTSDSAATFDAMLQAGVRGIVFQEVFGPHPSECDGSMQSLRQRVEMTRQKETELVRVGVSPHAPYTVSDELYRAVAEYSSANNLPVAVHIAESSHEMEYVTRGVGPFADLLRGRGILVAPRGRSPIDLLMRTGILETHPLLIHAINVDDDDLRLIRSNGATIVHCPLSNAALGHAVAPIAAYARAGIPTGLGTDSAIMNQELNVLEEAKSVAAAQMRSGGSAAARLFDSAKLLRMLTVEGARALGLEKDIGTLEVGKRADMAAFPVDESPDVGEAGPYDMLMRGGSGRDASMVMVDGRILRATFAVRSI